ncbi:RocR [Desulfamplus magnetovallimortis]|uniref:RocR n=1 Tax=Desulfamplus magnetovallimortis TaxID=1246637 RepID=A0A1W1HCD1_9BACT|nr:sigma 54-interacting transcriptional regulator [Desulfamplus magnetovallimortis]SLM30161.1 RocR [Desulfamplus magnetovallimortis]
MTWEQNVLKKHPVFDDMEMLKILFDMHEGVLIADNEGTILFYNATQSQIDDVEIDFALGKKIIDIYNLDENDSTTMQCMKSGKPVRNHVIVYQTKLGKVANTISNVFPLLKDGEVTGAISFTKDYQMLEGMISKNADSTKKNPRNRENGTRFVFNDLIGSNNALLQAVNAAKLSADSPSPIMLSGETGTGKELFAQSIHNHRAASMEKFIPINCSAIPENLLEGILFGTSKGAFTGSIDKAGLFEQGNRGTIFLDELDSMPKALQAKVLRVVQEKKVRRLGSLEEIDLNIKIISSVSKTPHQIISSDLLRRDLFYRMGVVFILIPPLRDRIDDMPKLVSHFIHKFNRTLGEKVKGLSDRVNRLFHQYQWPGNVRELEHVIEGAMNLVNGDQQICMRHIPPHVARGFDLAPHFQDTLHSTISPAEQKTAQSSKQRPLTLSEAQCANEKESICCALKETLGNAAKAARILGISPQSFHYKLKKYNIDRKNFFVQPPDNGPKRVTT